jgi:hypothetical protein
MKHCQWCDNSFISNVSYQIYCSAECRTAATKEKIAERYAASRRKKRYGKVRKCKSCDRNLSIYNDDTLCQKCLVNPTEVSRALKEMKGMANDED